LTAGKEGANPATRTPDDRSITSDSSWRTGVVSGASATSRPHRDRRSGPRRQRHHEDLVREGSVGHANRDHGRARAEAV